MSRIFVMEERTVEVRRREVILPDDFDPDDDDHVEKLETYYDGCDWPWSDIVSGDLTVTPVTSAEGEPRTDADELSWGDLSDD